MIWTATYETGNTQVDNEHKEIFTLVQKLLDSVNDEALITSTMDFLANYAVNHFRNEEHLMTESSYPDMAVHKKQHDDFVQEVLALFDRVKNESDTEKKSMDIEKVIVNWLIDHVLGSDKVMADHYRKWKM